MLLAGVPIGRWPLLAHAVCAMVVVAACSTTAYVWERAMATRRANASALLQQAEADLQTLSRQPTIAERPLPLADISRLDDFLRDLGQFATERTVKINSLNVGHSRTGSDIKQAEVSAQLIGDYTSTKSWLSEVLARYPSVALHSVAMRAADGGQLETSILLRLYIRGSK
jgi:Tfp pilus assembly protein PilO